MFDEDADQFAVARIDVVGPLDAGVDAEFGEGVAEGQRYGFRKQKLFGDGQECRFEYQREGEILAFGARPAVTPLSAPGGLALGPHDVAVAVLCVACVVVGRGGFLNAVNHRLRSFYG